MHDESWEKRIEQARDKSETMAVEDVKNGFADKAVRQSEIADARNSRGGVNGKKRRAPREGAVAKLPRKVPRGNVTKKK